MAERRIFITDISVHADGERRQSGADLFDGAWRRGSSKTFRHYPLIGPNPRRLLSACLIKKNPHSDHFEICRPASLVGAVGHASLLRGQAVTARRQGTVVLEAVDAFVPVLRIMSDNVQVCGLTVQGRELSSLDD